VIFASSDKDQASFDEYYKEMPWHAIPYSARDLKDKLSASFDCKGIPMLVVLDGNGKLVSANGRAEFKTYLPGGAAADAPASGGADKPKGGAACCVVS